MVECLRRDAEVRQDYSEFAHLSQSYLHRIHDLNEEIKVYLQSEPEAVKAVAAPRPDL